jgi:hypothetical protein
MNALGHGTTLIGPQLELSTTTFLIAPRPSRPNQPIAGKVLGFAGHLATEARH